MSDTTIAKAAGAAASFFLVGYAFSATHLSSAAFALAPTRLGLQQWRVVYTRGAGVSPPLSILGAAAWAYAAWSARQRQDDSWRAYAAAAAMTGGVVAWTLAAMLGTNKRLLSAATALETTGAFDERAVVGLLAAWDRLNLVRATIPLVGGLIGLVGAGAKA